MNDIRRSACFITLEGLDGAGKSTHVDWIAQTLRNAGVDLLCTREPGGTALGESLREILLHQPMDLRTEALLMFAARNEHLQTVIRPALARGLWVLCDRFTDASYAYQGGGRQMGAASIQVLEEWVQGDFSPDLTFLFDVPLAVARERLGSGRGAPDRFEREGAEFFERTRSAYHERVAAHPARYAVIDATQGIEAIRAVLTQQLGALLILHGYQGVKP